MYLDVCKQLKNINKGIKVMLNVLKSTFDGLKHFISFNFNFFSGGNISNFDNSSGNLTFSKNNGKRYSLLLAILKLIQHLWILLVAMFSSNISVPQLSHNFHPLFGQILLSRYNIDISVYCAYLFFLLRHIGFHDTEESLNTNADTDTWDRSSFWIKHSDKSIITTSASDTSNTDLLSGLVLGVSAQYSLVDDSSVIVQTSSKTKVKADHFSTSI